MEKICGFISRWMGLLVLAGALASYLFPEVTSTISTMWINPLLGVVMFGMGLTLSADDFKVVFSHPKEILLGCLAQYTLMPGIAWLLVQFFSLPVELAVGVILVGCCPGGTASNVITYLAKGDTALSVGMTGCSTLLAPVLTPMIASLLAGQSVEVDAIAMLLSILQVVIVPILAGLLVRRYFPVFTQHATAYLPAFSSLVITLIVVIVIGKNSEKLTHCGSLVILVVVLHNLLGLLLGYTIGKILRLPHPKCTAIAVEVGMQNSGLASSLASIHFAAYPLATIPGAIFSVWHNLSGAVLAKVFASVADKEKRG